MKIKDFSAQDKHVRVYPDTHEKLRTAAYNQKKKIKQVFEEIMSGKINPLTMELIK